MVSTCQVHMATCQVHVVTCQVCQFGAKGVSMHCIHAWIYVQGSYTYFTQKYSRTFQGLFKDQIMFIKHIIQTSSIQSNDVKFTVYLIQDPNKEFKYKIC